MQQGAVRSRLTAAIDQVRYRQAAARGRHTLLPVEQSSDRGTSNVGGRGARQVSIALAAHDIPNQQAFFLHGESCHMAGALSVTVLGFLGLSSDTIGVRGGYGVRTGSGGR